MSDAGSPGREVTLRHIFLEFLLIGATSFGGGVVAYLRSSLVEKRHWVDDPTFLELLSISQTLPGLNATNMATLVGDKLRGAWGAALAVLGICLPGAAVMIVAGMLYGAHGDRPIVTSMLHGVAAAAVGLVLAITFQLGRKSLHTAYDLIFVLLTVAAVHVLKLSVPQALLAVGALAILWYRPRAVENP